MSFIAKIKRQETPFFTSLYKIAKKVYFFNIPVNASNRWFFKSLFYCKNAIVGVFRFLNYKLIVEPTVRSIMTVGKGSNIERVPYITGTGKIELGSNIRLSGHLGLRFNNKCNPEPTFIVGNHTFIGHGTSCNIAEKISIGNHVLIAGNTTIIDNDGHPMDHMKRRTNDPVSKDQIHPVTIEDDVWIGSGAIVLKGVTIGARSIIGTGSVVTSDVPPDSIVVGNPGKILTSKN